MKSILSLLIIIIIGCNINKPSNKEATCLESAGIGSYDISDQAIQGRDYRGTFKDFSGRVFAFECNLDTQEVYYIAPKGSL